MPEFIPRLTANDPPAARIAEALRALFTKGYGGSFVICHAANDYAQVAGSNEEPEYYWDVARGAWYQGQAATPEEDTRLRALGLEAAAPGDDGRNYWAKSPAPPAAIDALARALWAALSQAFGHPASALRLEVNLEERLDKFG